MPRHVDAADAVGAAAGLQAHRPGDPVRATMVAVDGGGCDARGGDSEV
jgi:hypothetical protein